MVNLKDKIQFIIPSSVTDEDGFLVTDEVVKYECRSNFKALNGKEYFNSMTTAQKSVVSFRVRYCRAIKYLYEMKTDNYYIKFNNKKYNVIYVFDINNEHHFVDFKCEVDE